MVGSPAVPEITLRSTSKQLPYQLRHFFRTLLTPEPERGRDCVPVADVRRRATPHLHYPKSLRLAVPVRPRRRWRPVGRSASRERPHSTRPAPGVVLRALSSWHQVSDGRKVADRTWRFTAET